MSEPIITLKVARYWPGRDSRPTFQDYEIPYREDWVVLDALNYIKDYVDGTLSFRWSCRMGVCGVRAWGDGIYGSAANAPGIAHTFLNNYEISKLS